MEQQSMFQELGVLVHEQSYHIHQVGSGSLFSLSFGSQKPPASSLCTIYWQLLPSAPSKSLSVSKGSAGVWFVLPQGVSQAGTRQLPQCCLASDSTGESLLPTCKLGTKVAVLLEVICPPWLEQWNLRLGRGQPELIHPPVQGTVYQSVAVEEGCLAAGVCTVTA
jgi:hypothetical protein